MPRFTNAFTGQTSNNRHEIRKRVISQNASLRNALAKLNRPNATHENAMTVLKLAPRVFHTQGAILALPKTPASTINKLMDAYFDLRSPGY